MAAASLRVREARLAFWLLLPAAAVVLAVVVFPVAWTVWLSLKPVGLAELRDAALLAPNLTLKNYLQVLADPEFLAALRTTLVYASAGAGLSIFLGLLAALLLWVGFPGRNLVRGLVISPYIAPVVAVAFTWSFLLDPQLGLVNWLALKHGLISQPIAFFSQTHYDLSLFGLRLRLPLALTSVIVFEGWRYFPFAFLFILARLQAIPEELSQAAAVDGASPWQRFRLVTLPQLYPVLANLFLFRFIWTFNKFDDIFLLTRGQAGTKVLTVSVYDQAFGAFNIGLSSALAMVLFLVLAVFLAFYFRWIIRGAQAWV